MHKNHTLRARCSVLSVALLLITHAPAAGARAQDTVTGAFEGTVSNSQTRDRIAGALVEISNRATGLTIRRRTDESGRFYQGLLPPGLYLIRVSAPGFTSAEREQLLFTTGQNQVIPIPVALDPSTGPPAGVAQPQNTPVPPTPGVEDRRDVVAELNRTDARRSGAFSEGEVSTLPLGGVTLVRTFDELALLLPGVAPPPQTSGGAAGPGVGPGVGTSGQFAVNGLRSRANNFTVDGSDNNDEDIGVRRQGFFALVPQPIESVKEYQVITLLAPAQYGRNLGAQVNAVSKSGGGETHGAVYGFFNSSQLNARNPFDTADVAETIPLAAGSQQVLIQTRDGGGALVRRPLVVRNEAGGEDSFTLGQGGFALGGPVTRGRMFYFVSAEVQLLNATKEESFAVPTVEQRGPFRTGATGIFRDPFTGDPVSAIPNSFGGSYIFSLFPFPNNPGGVYGGNTFTQVLPAGARGAVLSAKHDADFEAGGRQQSVTSRYNFTDDRRDIPATGGALFSALRPRVRTQNFSFFFNSELSGAGSARPVFNQVRLSYGRTRLKFDELRDRTFLIPSRELPGVPFLLNAPHLLNVTAPAAPGVANTGPVVFNDTLANPSVFPQTTEDQIGLLGQVVIAGFSPAGVDVFNFPQRRVNNTYQFADQLTVRAGAHSLVFGTDNRRTELDSDLPRNSRPLVTFGGAPRLISENGAFRLPGASDPNPVVRAEDLASLGAASSFFQTLNAGRGDADINLRFYQLNFYGHDDWRVRPDLSLSFGLRYEYNTPARETSGLVEETFDDPALGLAPGLRQFVAGRTRIYEPDRNNFGPRVGLAYAPGLFGPARATVLRAGFGVFYDQVLGAVVSQSRNVFPTFITLNTGGLSPALGEDFLTLDNPSTLVIPVSGTTVGTLRSPGTLNNLNPELPLDQLLGFLGSRAPSALSATLPSRRLPVPSAYHYALTFEQQMNASTALSVAYVGTQGRHLLRFTTPNLGPGLTVSPSSLLVFDDFGLSQPFFRGFGFVPQRGVGGVGAVSIFETSANSRYDALQLQLRGRLPGALLYQTSYTYSEAADDVSDVFDLAGAPALPQNSVTFAGERGPANFDVRHRLTYNFVYSFPAYRDRGAALRFLLGGLQVASTGRVQTGQPFTVNSTIDVNLDGNLTDRPNSTDGIEATGDRSRPLRLTTDNPSGLLASFGLDGAVGRNTFRAGGVVELDLSLVKRFAVSGEQRLVLRAEFFNFINRANYGVPVRFLEAPGFGRATNTVTPGSRVQFGLNYSF